MTEAPLLTAEGDLTAAPCARDNQLAALGSAIGKFPTGAPSMQVYADFPANDNLPPVVAFTGVAGSGKSTAMRYLVERHGYTLLKFAGPLKRMLYAMGLTEDEVEGDLKELPQDRFYGKSPRYLMQTLGSDWARRLIGEDFWVRMWQGEASAILEVGGRVVTDDCRFPNEAQAIRRLGGDIYRIVGRGGIAGNHVSERGCGDEDLVLVNDSSLDALHGKIEEALRRFG